MALTYEELGTLMNDAAFRQRVKVSCLSYAAYILNEAANVPGHSSRVKWAQSTFQNPELAASVAQPPTCMDDRVKAAGKDVTDADLQLAVESAVNKLI